METNRSFVFGVAVSDYNFTSRQAEIKRLKANFIEGVNTIIISPRRWGKTSLVNRVCKELKDSNILFVTLDIFACKTEYEFYNALASAVLKQTATKVEQWMESARDFVARLTPTLSVKPEPNSDISISLGINPKTHTPEEILSLVETIAEKKGCRIVVCIDEFQQIGEMPDSISIQKRLRSVWQHQKLTSYCLFGSKRHTMSSMSHRRNMPFYQFGDMFMLKRIPTEDWIPYITSHFEERGKHISNEHAQMICETVDNYSSYVQQLAWYTFTRTMEGEVVTNEHIQLAIKELLDANELLFMEQIASLTAYQMNFLRALASGVSSKFAEENTRTTYSLGSASNIARLKTALTEKDLIQTDGSASTITDPVFTLWLKERIFHIA